MVESLGDVIDRLQYKVDNIKAKLEPSYFEECICYLKTLKNDWISCSEELPELGQYVIACVNPKVVETHNIIIMKYNNESFWQAGYIVAWRPLPEPYKEE